jgi:hypothetical protein
VALLFLAPFYIAIAIAYHKAKLKNDLETFKTIHREYPEDNVDEALDKIFGGN